MATASLSPCQLQLWQNMGKTPQGPFFQSPQWDGRRFRNTLPRVALEYGEILKSSLKGRSKFASPVQEVPIQRRVRSEFSQKPGSGLRVTWLGHSSSLVELEGMRLLIDPVWGQRASPFSFAGVKRFHPPPLPFEQLPDIDAVLISHDHYDHLDRETVMKLASQPIAWFVPLGVGSHLQYWGVAPEQITELDWWNSARLGPVELTSVPARHDSGRSIFFTDRQNTLWCGWSIRGERRSVFYSGDTGMHHGFRQVGQRLGPFDISLIEIGAYDALWADHHMGPEQAVQAHLHVQANILLPVHWGTFQLAPHSWTEPIERLTRAAEQWGVSYALPKPGQSVDPEHSIPQEAWWPELPWRNAKDYPIHSSFLS